MVKVMREKCRAGRGASQGSEVYVVVRDVRNMVEMHCARGTCEVEAAEDV